MFYRIEENKLYDFADYEYAENCLETDIITQAELAQFPNKVIVVDGELILNPEFETEEEQKEKKRIGNLKLTKREVFLGIYKAKQISPEQIRALITDTEALIEFDYANDYFADEDGYEFDRREFS